MWTKLRTTLTEISENTRRQIEKYVTSNYIDSVIVDVIENDKTGKKNTIGILLNLSKTFEGKENMILTFDKANKTGKIISKIYI